MSSPTSSPDDFTGPAWSAPAYGDRTGSEGTTTMRMIFVNLPVEDLPASRAFFTALGFEFNTDFSDASCACMVVDRNIFVMLLVRRRFGDVVIGRIADATAVTEVITCLSADSREQVDDTVARAIAAGGKPWQPTVEDGPMYGGSFQDLDGHVWELVHMADA